MYRKVYRQVYRQVYWQVYWQACRFLEALNLTSRAPEVLFIDDVSNESAIVFTCSDRVHMQVMVEASKLTSRARGSFCLKVGFAQEGFPSSTPSEAGDAALPRSTPCSISLQLKSMPPMLYRTWLNHWSLQEGSLKVKR